MLVSTAPPMGPRKDHEMVKPLNFIGAALLSTFAATSLQAQDASTVITSVNGTDITLGHVIASHARLPQQYRDLPPEVLFQGCLLYTSPSPRDGLLSRMPSSA